MYKPIADTKCSFINSLEDLVALNEKLCKLSEFAVDLEVSQFVCLCFCFVSFFNPRVSFVWGGIITLCSPSQHHSYRSFLGLTCLMQISTREEDFIIDTLELRSELYILNEVFTDPSVVKVRDTVLLFCYWFFFFFTFLSMTLSPFKVR